VLSQDDEEGRRKLWRSARQCRRQPLTLWLMVVMGSVDVVPFWVKDHWIYAVYVCAYLGGSLSE
jgi:hypothetical protein